MKALVTGANGLIGANLVRVLLNEGAQVRALVRKTSKVDFLKALPKVELAYGAIEDAASVKEAARGCDAIIHAAGLVKAKTEDEFFAVNVGGIFVVIPCSSRSFALPELNTFMA